MAFKFVSMLALFALANAGLLPQTHIVQTQPQLLQRNHLTVSQPATLLHKDNDEYDPNPQYSYSYDIQDDITGDSKSQHESRDGDVVKGHYSVVDADGHKRTVQYTADPINGFNAVVSREPIHGAYHAQQQVVAQPIIKASPIQYHASPAIVHSAPALVHSSPAIVHSAPALVRSSPTIVHSAPAIVRSSTALVHSAPALTAPRAHVSYPAAQLHYPAAQVHYPAQVSYFH